MGKWLRRTIRTVTMAAIGVVMIAGSALALPINGTISFYGHVNLTGYGVNQNPFLNATGIHFLDAKTDLYGSSGIFTSIPDAQAVTYADFLFRPDLTSSITPLWTLTVNGTTFSFDLSTVTVTATATSLSLHGTGILKASGYEDTVGVWDLTTQSGTARLSFSASSAPVPEPGTIMLLGSGLLGLALYGRRRIKA